MSKYSEMVALLEWAKAQSKPPKTGRFKRKKGFDPRDFDATAFIHKEIERAEALKKLLSDYEKSNKKEEKKEEKKMHVQHLALALIVSFPIIAPLYVQYIKALLN